MPILTSSNFSDATATIRSGNGPRRGGIKMVLLVALTLVAVVAVGGYAAMVAMAGDRDARTLELHTVARSSFDITVTASGELEPRRQTEIRSQLESANAIVEIVEEGKIVREGDLLVRLNSEQIENQYKEETLRVESARAEYVSSKNAYDIQISENESNLRKAQLKLDLAEIERQKWLEGDVKKQRLELDLAIERAERRLEQAQEKLDETKQLFDRGFSSREDLVNAQIAFLDAEAGVQTTQIDKWVFDTFAYDQRFKELTSNVEEARAELEQVERQNERQLANRRADLTNRERQLQIREENLAKMERQLDSTSIHAPTDGLVIYATSTGRGRGGMMMMGDGPMQIGRNIRPNELIMMLPDTEQMMAVVRVHESLAGRVRPGQQTSVTIDALQGQSFSGRVHSIGVLAESEGWRDPNLREYTVRIVLDRNNTDGMLKPSMRADARIVLGSVEDSLATPIQAIFREGPVSYVYTPRGSRFERTPIAVGRRSSTHAEIVAGLSEGDLVLMREPSTGEVLDTKFDEEQLARLREAMPMRMGMPPGMAATMPPGAVAAPGGASPGGGAAVVRQRGQAGAGQATETPAARPTNATEEGAAAPRESGEGANRRERPNRESRTAPTPQPSETNGAEADDNVQTG